MVGCSRREVDARAPSFVQRVDRRVDHTGESLDALQLAHRRHRQDCLDRGAQAVIVDGPGKTASKAHRRLLEGHDLEAMTTVACRGQAAFPHGETTVNDQGGSARDGHGRSPSGSYFLFGRWVSVEGPRKSPSCTYHPRRACRSLLTCPADGDNNYTHRVDMSI